MNLSLLSVEIITAILGLLVLVLGLVAPANQRKGIGYFTILSLTALLAVAFVMHGTNGTVFGMYLIDSYSSFFKITFILAAILVCMFSSSYLDTLGYNQSQFFALTVFALLGMMIMASAGDFITLYMGLELMTITFVVLTAYKHGDKKGSEAGMKYILLSAMSSGVLLYGLSILYGAAGSVIYTDMVETVTAGNLQPFTVMGLVFLLAGFGFKISMVPFHMWSPDIYEGAPTPVTAFLAVGSKAAGFAALLRMFMIAIPGTREVWMTVVVTLCALTIVLGNFVAIPQTNIKRMLAYSSIAHAGYILMGLVAFSQLGIAAVLYYVMLYLFANAGAFAAATAFGNLTGSDEIRDYSGMWKRSPLIASVMLLSLLSLAGIPPLAGFFGKFYLFTAIIDQGYIWLAFLGIGMSMVSVYYYLIVVKVMFLGNPLDDTPVPVSLGTKAVLVISALASLFLGIYQGPLTGFVTKIAQVFLPM